MRRCELKTTGWRPTSMNNILGFRLHFDKIAELKPYRNDAAEGEHG